MTADRRSIRCLHLLTAMGIAVAAMCVVWVSSAHAAIHMPDGPPGDALTFSAVDQDGNELNLPIYPNFGTDGFPLWSGVVGSRSTAFVQGPDSVADTGPLQVPFFLDFDAGCNGEEPQYFYTDDAEQNVCWSVNLGPYSGPFTDAQWAGTYGPSLPRTATGAGGEALVFDHWVASNVGVMGPVFPGQKGGTSGYCHSGDEGLDRGYEPGFRDFVNLITGVGANASITGVYAPASPDTTAPMVTISDVLDCSVFVEGADVSTTGVPAAYDFRCDDLGEGTVSGPTGVKSCVGKVNGVPITDGAPIDTSTPGTYTLTVTSTDHAGNKDVRHATYKVVAPSSVTSSTAPTTLQGGSFSVSFDQPVKGVTGSDVTVMDVAKGAKVASTVLCLDSSAAKVSCASGPVSTVQLAPKAALTAGASYSIAVNQPSAGVVNKADGIAVGVYSQVVQAQTVFGYNDYPITAKWGVVTDPDATGGSYQQERSAGATVSYDFTSGETTDRFRTGPAMGIATVQVADGDQVSTQNVDLYASTPGNTEVVSDDDNPGTHHVTITVTGTDNPASAGTNVGFEGALDGDSPIAATGVLSDGPGDGYFFSGQKGATITFGKAYGEGIKWNAVVGPNAGKANVFIDNKKVATEDLYAPDYADQSYVFDTTLGYHTIKIVVTGTKQKASADTIVRSKGFSVLSAAQ